ncbi:hypothetical protein LIER_09306 [Lithospermum erythrorhizon]|uniref:Uncharacterized protein n=1 Tax=Lithospermum erythrorhizon TaxID=34254 RepID=A0AAV3PGA8_LITER
MSLRSRKHCRKALGGGIISVLPGVFLTDELWISSAFVDSTEHQDKLSS